MTPTPMRVPAALTERQIENARLLEKVPGAKTFDQWRAVGKWVKRGERMKAFRVRAGVIRAGIDPITGEDRYEPKWATAYGFTADQVR